MENGKWKMGNGRWKMENGRWKMEAAAAFPIVFHSPFSINI